MPLKPLTFHQAQELERRLFVERALEKALESGFPGELRQIRRMAKGEGSSV